MTCLYDLHELMNAMERLANTRNKSRIGRGFLFSGRRSEAEFARNESGGLSPVMFDGDLCEDVPGETEFIRNLLLDLGNDAILPHVACSQHCETNFHPERAQRSETHTRTAEIARYSPTGFCRRNPELRRVFHPAMYNP
jgi:hypothetical protein